MEKSDRDQRAERRVGKREERDYRRDHDEQEGEHQ